MNRTPYHRLVPIGGLETIDLRTAAFGEELPVSAGVYVVLTAPQSMAEMNRGFGSILLVGSSENLDAAIGSGHGNHPRLSSLIANRAAEVGYVIISSADERDRISERLTRMYLQK